MCRLEERLNTAPSNVPRLYVLHGKKGMYQEEVFRPAVTPSSSAMTWFTTARQSFTAWRCRNGSFKGPSVKTWESRGKKRPPQGVLTLITPISNPCPRRDLSFFMTVSWNGWDEQQITIPVVCVHSAGILSERKERLSRCVHTWLLVAAVVRRLPNIFRGSVAWCFFSIKITRLMRCQFKLRLEDEAAAVEHLDSSYKQKLCIFTPEIRLRRWWVDTFDQLLPSSYPW